MAYNFDKDPNWTQKGTRLPWQVNLKIVFTAQKHWNTLKTLETLELFN